MYIYNMYKKEFENDTEKLTPNHLLVFAADDKGISEYYENSEMWDKHPVVFYEITTGDFSNIPRITFWDNPDREPYLFSFSKDSDMPLEKAIERYLDSYEEYQKNYKEKK